MALHLIQNHYQSGSCSSCPSSSILGYLGYPQFTSLICALVNGPSLSPHFLMQKKAARDYLFHLSFKVT